MGKFVIISGLSFDDNNRGTSALGYGAVSFLCREGLLSPDHELINIRFVHKFWKAEYRKPKRQEISLSGHNWKRTTYHVFSLEKLLAVKFGIKLPFTTFGRLMKNVEYVAAINGGDGFSDIYGKQLFYQRIPETMVAMGLGIPHIVLPQTLGPFDDQTCLSIADKILTYSKSVYVRDLKYKEHLDAIHVKFKLTRDLSYYMEPCPWDLDVMPDAIGVNVSGLCYFNGFHSLRGQFEFYPQLMASIVSSFQNMGKTVYLIPHSYNYYSPEPANDDLAACKELYSTLKNTSCVHVLDYDMTSPQVKYAISKMSFFIGTRMHSNFAAIYTNVPVFGLSYSYKFDGAFLANGQDCTRQTARIDNIVSSDIPIIMDKIIAYFNSSVH